MFFLDRFMKSENFMSFPFGILSYHRKYLCHERHWLHGCDSIKAIWNQKLHGIRWEHMSFVTALTTT